MKRILVFANGEPPKLGFKIPEHDLVYCADGGARIAKSLGLKIDLIVGDLDSLEADEVRDFQNLGVIIARHPPDKDQTDLELCLLEAVKLKPSQITLVAASGGRFDHHLGNLFLLTRQEFLGISLRVIDETHQLFLLRSGEILELEGAAAQTFSLLPISGLVHGVHVSGARWPLSDAKLSLGDGRTISNEFSDEVVKIKIASGLLFVVLNHQN